MALVALVSAKGSPGVTTLTRVLAGLWPRRCVAVELDPTGGDLAARGGLGLEPGLASLALAARSGLSATMLDAHAQRLEDGAAVVVAPARRAQAGAAVAVVAEQLSALAADLDDLDVLADCGRLDTWSPLVDVVRRAVLVVVVARPSLEGLAHTQGLLDEAVADATLGVVLVGERDYPAKEVARTLSAPLLGVVADDPRGARLAGGVGVRRARRTLLVRSAASVVTTVASQLAQPAVKG